MKDEKLQQAVQAQKEALLENLFSLLRINSERSTAEPGAPYGPGPKRALETALAIAGKLGFETEMVADQVGIAKYIPAGWAGDGEEDYIAIVGHLDVVPAEGNWSHPPYEPQIRQRRIYARGVLDNKGPLLAALFALHAVKQAEIQLTRPVWILFGTNEETGMEDMAAYLKVKRPPKAGFTPDCKFPVVYAERGRAAFRLRFEDELAASRFKDHYATLEDLRLSRTNPVYGSLQLQIRQENASLEYVFRYPFGMKSTEIERQLKERLPDETILEQLSDWPPVRHDPHGHLCRILAEVYEDVTGQDGSPVTTSGGTYALRLPGIVPFGPSFPGQRDIAHRPDEWMDIEDLMRCLEIFALAIVRLAGAE